MTQELIGVLLNAGVAGFTIWWLSQQLIPQLRQEREATLAAFRAEMMEERRSHQTEMKDLVTANAHAVDGLLDHMKEAHVGH